MGNKQASTTNRMMDQSYNQYNNQRTGFQNYINTGLEGAQGRSDQAFNAALAGYQGLLGRNADMANRAIAAGQKSAEGIMGMGGPGNPWAGQLGRDIRARGNSVLPAMYDRIRAEQQRLQNAQGGYNPGFTEQLAKTSREQARAATENTLNVDIALGEKIAAARAAQAQFDLQKRMMAGRAGQGGYGSAAGFGKNSLAALQGIYNLRGQTPGEVGMYLQAGMGNMTGGQQGALAALGQRAAYNPNTSWFDKAMGGLGMAAGFAAPFMPRPRAPQYQQFQGYGPF